MSIIKQLKDKVQTIKTQTDLTNYQANLLILAEQDKISYQDAKELSAAAKEYFELVQQFGDNDIVSIDQQANEQLEAIDYTQYTDLELIEDGAFMPFLQYQFLMQWTHKMTQTMFNVYYCLCYHAKYGQVVGLSTMDIAEFIGHSSDSKVVQAIAKLEEMKLISVNRDEVISSYTVTGYKQAILKGGKGGYIMPLELFKKLQNYNLKHYRLVWYLVAHKHHMPNNTAKSGIKQATLKNITNSVSFKELRQLIKDLAGVIFEAVDNFWTKVKRVLMKSLRLTFDFIQLGIEIVEDTIEEVENHHLYDRVKYMLSNMKIDNTKQNIKKAINKIGQVSEFAFREVENLSRKPNIFSKYNTVNCLLKLLESKDNSLRG